MNLKAFVIAATIPAIGMTAEPPPTTMPEDSRLHVKFECIVDGGDGVFYARYKYPDGHLMDEASQLTEQGRNINRFAHEMTANTADFGIREVQSMAAKDLIDALELRELPLTFEYRVANHAAAEGAKGLNALQAKKPLCESLYLGS